MKLLTLEDVIMSTPKNAAPLRKLSELLDRDDHVEHQRAARHPLAVLVHRQRLHVLGERLRAEARLFG